MEKSSYPLKRNDYIYSKNTARGFLRMQRQGVPRPIFSAEDKVKKALTKAYGRILRSLLEDFMAKAKEHGIVPDQLTSDAEDTDPIKTFLQLLAEQEAQSRKTIENMDLKMKLQATAQELEQEWMEPYVIDPETGMGHTQLEEDIWAALKACQKDYLGRLYEDASPELRFIVSSFNLDKQKLYNENMDEIRRLYLDNSMQRIKGETDLLKKAFLQKLNDYITGKSDTLDIEKVTDQLAVRSKKMSQFFARDQLSRFNKATMLAQYKAAGVKTLKWITTHDVRVRDSHRKLDGVVFDIDNLPPEINDYNCRCGLIPEEYNEL